MQCQFVRSPLKLGGDGRLYALNVFPTPLETAVAEWLNILANQAMI